MACICKVCYIPHKNKYMDYKNKVFKTVLAAMLLSATALSSSAQNLISSGSPLYKLPYKNTYVMQTLVAENTFRTAKQEKTKPGSFEEARKILPSP